MRRATGYIVILLVTLAGCAGCGSSAERADSSPSTSTSLAPDGSGGTVPGEPGGGPVENESDRDPGEDGAGNGGGGAEDERAIEIGGPTLDNTFPTNPFALPSVGGTSCVLFTNDKADVPTTVHSVRLVDQQPAGDPGLALGTNPSSHDQCVPEGPDYPDTIDEAFSSCTNATLEPGERTACPVEVRSTGEVGTDYTATLVLRLSAVCTGTEGTPCDRVSDVAEPSPDRPVTVVWTDTRNYSSCLVPRERNGAEFLDEESDGRCPAADGNGETPPSSEPDPDQVPGSGEDPGEGQTEPAPETAASSDNG